MTSTPKEGGDKAQSCEGRLLESQIQVTDERRAVYGLMRERRDTVLVTSSFWTRRIDQ
jgi:hypothetical protein